MKTVPMIFNQQMVKALVDGRKTVTRRPLSNQPIKNGSFWDFKWGSGSSLDYLPIVAGHATANAAPFKVGDLIWVRETFCLGRLDEVDAEHPADRTLFVDQGCGDEYFIQKEWAVSKGADELDEVKWKPSIHMPRKASRLTLRVTDVRCERLQKIGRQQVIKEGFNDWTGFAFAWSCIYSSSGKGWDESPWVWVIEFEVIKSNIDKVVANECN
ncbi:phage-like protein [Pseudoalteromonas distincta]|uniref:hypothetical protein n=1 Tax=Pseudoalteromonas distincta TaxID=77608 RepID=UPI00020A0BB1|nr:hypothetical protein [Pseudoalteromonas distincta]EGI72864.1 phage-like protein [Pseudoalteromonas distincta]